MHKAGRALEDPWGTEGSGLLGGASEMSEGPGVCLQEVRGLKVSFVSFALFLFIFFSSVKHPKAHFLSYCYSVQ